MGSSISDCKSPYAEDEVRSENDKRIEALKCFFPSNVHNYTESTISIINSTSMVVETVPPKPFNSLFSPGRQHCAQTIGLDGSSAVSRITQMWTQLGHSTVVVNRGMEDGIVVVPFQELYRSYNTKFSVAYHEKGIFRIFNPSFLLTEEEARADFELLVRDEGARCGAVFCLDFSTHQQDLETRVELTDLSKRLFQFQQQQQQGRLDHLRMFPRPQPRGNEVQEQDSKNEMIGSEEETIVMIPEYEIHAEIIPESVTIAILDPEMVPYYYSTFMRHGIRVGIKNGDMYGTRHLSQDPPPTSLSKGQEIEILYYRAPPDAKNRGLDRLD